MTQFRLSFLSLPGGAVTVRKCDYQQYDARLPAIPPEQCVECDHRSLRQAGKCNPIKIFYGPDADKEAKRFLVEINPNGAIANRMK